MPVLVVGGLEGWKKEVGDTDIVRGDRQATPKTRGGSENPFRNGMVFSGSLSPSLAPDSHQMWTPPIRQDGVEPPWYVCSRLSWLDKSSLSDARQVNYNGWCSPREWPSHSRFII
jgi:hypothetical protein